MYVKLAHYIQIRGMFVERRLHATVTRKIMEEDTANPMVKSDNMCSLLHYTYKAGSIRVTNSTDANRTTAHVENKLKSKRVHTTRFRVESFRSQAGEHLVST